MGRLATMAEAHYKRWLPQQYAKIKDREAFFRALEDEAEEQIEELAETLIGPAPEGETMADRLARHHRGRQEAEWTVIRDVIRPDPNDPSRTVREVPPPEPDDPQLVDAMQDFRDAAEELADLRRAQPEPRGPRP